MYVPVFQKLIIPDLGLRVFWNGYSSLQIRVPVHYNNTMCGLCGDFNGNPWNDWTMGPDDSCIDPPNHIAPGQVVNIKFF